jgi:NAD(P)-dependent dehydrogenase (short-subunit alcohol dehydrogenase family)
MSYQGRQVIVTGGTGTLGSAVVGALIEAGATCYVPWRHEAEVERFAYREHDQVKLFGSIDFTDESAVARLFGEVPALWASVHVAGGFAMGPVAKASKADLMPPPRHEFSELFPLLFACGQCHHPFGTGGPHCQCRSASRSRMAWRRGTCRLYGEQGCGRGADRSSLRGGRQGWDSC